MTLFKPVVGCGKRPDVSAAAYVKLAEIVVLAEYRINSIKVIRKNQRCKHVIIASNGSGRRIA